MNRDALIAELATLLGQLPEAASQGFAAAREPLCCEVLLAASGDPELLAMLGDPGLEVDFGSVRARCEFWRSVFDLGLARLVVTTVPWIYRSQQARGFSASCFQRLLRLWMRAVEQVLPARQARPILEVFAWIHGRHDEWLRLAQDTGTGAATPEGAWAPAQRQFLVHLLNGDRPGCLLLAEAMVKTQDDLRQFFVQVLTPALYEVGRLWETGRISVGDEQRASGIASLTMDTLFHLLVPFRGMKGRVLITCSTNECHELGGRMVADLLAGDGWSTAFLGANVDPRELLSLVRHIQPHVLGISIALPLHLKEIRELIAAVRLEPGFRRSRVVIGGNAARNDPDLWRALGADGQAPDALAAIALLEAWWLDMAPLGT